MHLTPMIGFAVIALSASSAHSADDVSKALKRIESMLVDIAVKADMNAEKLDKNAAQIRENAKLMNDNAARLDLNAELLMKGRSGLLDPNTEAIQ